MIIRFLIYGITGWCMEIIWTGLCSFLKRDLTLVATTSIWMFFIYGLVILFEPFYPAILTLPIVFRGGLYAVCIFFVEYSIGSVMKRAKVCPWDYSDSKYSVNGIIRLDYAPVWAIAGLIYEYIYRLLVKL